MEFPHIYPDPESRRLRKALAKDCGVPVEHILIGCGADELIDLLMRVVLDPQDVIINTPPTFGMYAFDCAVNDGKVVNVPRLPAPNFGINVEEIERAVFTHKPKLLFLTSPNNPDGSIISGEELDAILKLPVLVVLDEAYIEFDDNSVSQMPEVANYENLIVLRTFSKRAGLAGLRVGYGAFPRSMMEFLWRAKQPYNVSAAAELAACAALSNPEYLEVVKDKLICERKRLFSMLQGISYLTPYPSSSNFILCRVKDRDALELKFALEQEGVMVRHYSKPMELAGCIRISVGRPEHTDALCDALLRL